MLMKLIKQFNYLMLKIYIFFLIIINKKKNIKFVSNSKTIKSSNMIDNKNKQILNFCKIKHIIELINQFIESN